MYYKFEATKDTFICSQSTSYNYGKDALLEVGRIAVGSNVYPIRSLVQFDTDDIIEKISNGVVSSGSKFDLKLYECLEENINEPNYWIDVYLVSKSWDEGSGIYGNIISSSCTWINSLTNSTWNNQGGDYITNISSSQYFDNKSGDLNVDVTELLGYITASIWNNYGFIIRLRDENDIINFNRKIFYSRDSSTIYKPELIAKWNDAVLHPSASEASEWKDYIISIPNMQKRYNKNDRIRFNIFCRERFPSYSYSTKSLQDMRSIVLKDLYYGIVNYSNGDIILSQSAYTSCSSDENTNYFIFDMSILEPYSTYFIRLYHKFMGSWQIYNMNKFQVVE